MIGLGLDGYEPDSGHESAIAFRIRVVEAEQYIPAHSHRKGQLILALHGALTCEVENAMWMVPPQYAVWVPGQLSHSNRATPGAQVCFLFIEPGAAPMPDRCCTLKISPLVRELILTLAERGGESLAAPATARLVQVLFDELPRQPQEHAAALDADPLLYELEIAAGDCGRGVCFVARRARRLPDGLPAASGGRAAGRYSTRRRPVSRRPGRAADCRRDHLIVYWEVVARLP